MTQLHKRVRHHYWLFTSFIRKNGRFLLVSFVSGFFIILAFINFFPFLNTLIFQDKQTIGIVGNYTLASVPPEITSQISSPLISIDQNGEIKPVLASSWEVLNEGKTYRLRLKDDLFWTDGKKLTASSIDFNFQDVEVKATDTYDLDFNLAQPLNIFPIYLTKPVIKAPLEGVGGVYSVQSYQMQKGSLETINLSPNRAGMPLKVYRFYTSEDDMVTAYKKGEISTFYTSNRSIAELFANWKNTEIERNVDYNQIVTLFFNTQSSILQDRDVRKGFAYSSPAFSDYGVPAKSPIPPSSWAYSDSVREYGFNKERGVELIGGSLTATESAKLSMYTFFDYIDVAQELKTQYEEAGLEIDLKIVSVVPQEFDLLLAAWNPPNDPDQYFFWHSTQNATNLTKFNSQKIDKLLEDGRRVVNVRQRDQIYEDFQKNIVEEAPAVFLYHPYTYTMSRK